MDDRGMESARTGRAVPAEPTVPVSNAAPGDPLPQQPIELLRHRLRRRLRAERRIAPATAVSIGLHILLVIFLAYALRVPSALSRVFGNTRPPVEVEEQLRYVTVQPTSPTAAPATPRRELPRQATATPPAEAAPPLVAPTEVPNTLPPSRADTAARPEPSPIGIAGPIGGGAGPTKGAQPTFSDPRVWVTDPALVYAPKSEIERLDSALVSSLNRYRDSLDANTYQPNRFERGDWTVERGGQKWGIDQQAIRLGPVSIPTALLALLPLNRMQGNPIAAERDRAMAAMRADIMYHANAAMNEEQFRKAVKAIRDRKERERREATRNPGPVRSPGDRPPR